MHAEHSTDMQQSTMTLIEKCTAYGLWCIGGLEVEMALSSRRRMYSIDPQIGAYKTTGTDDLLTSHGYEGLLPYLIS